jgi:uncharacterized protein (TIGR02145 family)/prepilin-type N-terminal cleavage/methylation domain-containing protein
MLFFKKHNSRGFTLLEILLVIGIIAVLAGIVIIAINPSKQLATVRNAQRKSNLSEINKALTQYYIDHSSYPASVTTSLTEICNTGASSTPTGISCTGLIDLSALVPTYLVAIPTDPLGSTLSFLDKFIPTAYATTNGTGYKVMKDPANKVVLTAFQAENNTIIGIGIWCPSPLVDARDGKSYTTIAIGTQCWMQQNLNVGTLVAGVTTQTNNSIIEKYCYSNSEGNCTTYGGLYQWNEMMGYITTAGAQGICPTGWHIPTHNEFTTLELATCTSGSCVANFPYDSSTTGWRGTNEGTTLKNVAGLFRGLLAGDRNTDGSFGGLSGYAYLWSSLQSGTSAWRRGLSSGYASVLRFTNDEAYGFSVRCLKD